MTIPIPVRQKGQPTSQTASNVWSSLLSGKKNSLDEDLPLQKPISFFRLFVQVFFFARLSGCSSFHLGFLSNLPRKDHLNHPMLRPLSTPFCRQPIWVDKAERGFGMMIGVRSRLMVAINLLTIGALVREKYRSYFHNCLFQNISKACFQKKQHCHTAVDELMMKRYQSKARPFLQELQFPLGVALRLEFLRSARCKIPLKNIENHSIL